MEFQDFRQKLENRNFPIDFPGHWIDGQWLQSKSPQPIKGSFNPNSNELLVEPTADKTTMHSALEAAISAKPRLEKLSFDQRLELVQQMRQVLADFQQASIHAMCVESGKPRWEAQADFDAAILFLDAIGKRGSNLEKDLLAPAQMSGTKGDYFLVPAGVTVAFLPFSTPITSFVYTFCGAVLAGCPLILCPSSHAVLSGLLYGYLDQNINLPKGSFTVVFGNFETFKKVIADKRIQAIIYTGSREHCELIRRESRHVAERQLILQSGGKNSSLIHSSADIDTAVKCVMMGALKSAGQLCTSTSRVFVHRSKTADFTEKLVASINDLVVGRTDLPTHKNQSEPLLGPLYSQKAVEKFLRYQTMAHREAKTDLIWGKSVDAKSGGCLVKPGVHLIERFDKSSGYQANVLFCPDLAIYEYDVLDEAIDLINSTDAPYVVSFIGDPEIIQPRKRQFLAPNLVINLPTTEVENTPFPAGRFKSGNHRYNGAALALLLSFPSLMHTAGDGESSLNSWPWPKN